MSYVHCKETAAILVRSATATREHAHHSKTMTPKERILALSEAARMVREASQSLERLVRILEEEAASVTPGPVEGDT